MGTPKTSKSCSGELDSLIEHHLHNSSFITNDVNGIETADETNACIWLVMRNGFEKGRTLIFDNLTQREKSEEVVGIRDYSQEILECHETYVEELQNDVLSLFLEWGYPCGTSTTKQELFLHRWGLKHAAIQDLKLLVAGKLVKVEMIPDFFQSRQ
jgi:hypothetical protein